MKQLIRRLEIINQKTVGRIELTVGKKLYASFIIILLFMGFLGSSAMIQLQTVNSKSKIIASSRLPGIEMINDISFLTEHVRSLELRTLIEPNQSLIGELNGQTRQAMAKIDDDLGTYAKSIAGDDERENYNELKAEWEKYKSLHNQFVDLSKKIDLLYKGAGDRGDQLLQFIRDSQKVFDNMQINISFLVKINHDGALSASEESQKVYRAGVASSLFFIVISLVISMLLAYLITRNISKPVRLVSRALEQVASGDLRVREIMVKNRDEIGALVRSLNQMVGNLQRVVNQTRNASVSVSSASEELAASSKATSLTADRISSAMQEVAAGAEYQMNAFTETSTAMEEMSRGIQHIAEASGHASDIAMATSEGAKKGNEMLQAAVRRMESINGTVLKTADELTHLKQRSSEIGGIVNIITDIAVQTNLLSLNASIEAARAGEHGRGFAVVAAEVKKLADESERSAKQIRSLIHGIQADTNVTVASMSEGVREIEEGMRSIRSAGTAFAEIVAASKRLSARIQDIASASEQLSASSEQVSASVSELTGIAKRASERTQLAASSSKEQLAAIEEIAKSSDSMTYVARDLQHIIGMFKIGTE